LSFYIPYDCESTGNHRWDLEVRARVPGPNYYAHFRVPVFKTPESSLEVPQDAIELFGDAIDKDKRYFEGGRTRVNPLPGGGLEVITPSVRSWSLGGVFGAITLGCAWLDYVLAADGNPLWAGIFVASPIGILAALITAWIAFGRCRVTVEKGTIHTRMEVLGIGWGKRLASESVLGVGHKVDYRANGKPRSLVFLQFEGGRATVSSGLEPGEARWLSKVLKSFLEETEQRSVDYLGDDPDQ